jgi:hypothetical protein
MRLPSFLRRPEPAPVSPRMQALLDRARHLRWEVSVQSGPSFEYRELERVKAQIAALELDEAQQAAAAG